MVNNIEENPKEFDEEYEKLLTNAVKYFEDTNVFCCGDFQIVYTGEYPTRPNMCGYSDFN